MEKNTAFSERVQGRLDRLDLSAEDASRAAGLPSLFIGQVARGDIAPPRGKRLIQLAEILSTSVSYLIGLDPDAPVPEEYLEEEQGNLGLLAGDEDALLRAYRRLDVSTRVALIQIILKLAPDPGSDDVQQRQIGQKGSAANVFTHKKSGL